MVGLIIVRSEGGGELGEESSSLLAAEGLGGGGIILTCSLWLNCEERRSTWPSRRHIEGDSAAAIRIGLLHIAVLKSYTKPLHELTTAFSPAIIKIWVQSIEYTSIAIANSVKPYSSSAIYIYKRCVVRYPKNVLLTGWCIHTDTKYSFHWKVDRISLGL